MIETHCFDKYKIFSLSHLGYNNILWTLPFTREIKKKNKTCYISANNK